MLKRVPKLSRKLRNYVLQLATNPKPQVSATYARLKEQVEGYAQLPAAIEHDVLEHLEYCAILTFTSIARSTAPTPSELEVIAEVARRRVHQAVPLASLLRAFRFGGLEIWRACIACPDRNQEVREQLLFPVSGFVLELFDSLSQTMASAYLDEQYQRARWRDSLRYELVSLVFQFPDDVPNFDRTSEALGIDPTVPRVALALQLSLPISVPSALESHFESISRALARRLKIAVEDLVHVFRRGRMIIWVPAVSGETVIGADRRIAKCGMQLLKATSEIQAIGIGLLSERGRGWSMSVDEAIKALELGLREGPSRGVHRYSNIAVIEGARRTDNVFHYLQSLAERLAAEPDLLMTLRSFFKHKQRRQLTASSLGIHPNTLNHRLARVETILDADLADADWIARLHIAVRLNP